MSDMVSSIGTALVTNMVAGMDPTRGLVLDQLKQMGRQAEFGIEDSKRKALAELYKELEIAEAHEPRSVAAVDSLTRSIKRIEAI